MLDATLDAMLEEGLLLLIKLDALLLEIMDEATDEELAGLLLAGALDATESQAPRLVHASPAAQPVPGEYASLARLHQPPILHWYAPFAFLTIAPFA